MILSETEIQNALTQSQAAFPAFSEWAYHNAKDEDYFGFSLWGSFRPDPDVLMPRTFFITLDTYEQQWAGHLTIGQHAYVWSSTDMGDAHLVDSDPCDSVEGAIASLKTEIQKLFAAFSIA
jgi:hypothetical protein